MKLKKQAKEINKHNKDKRETNLEQINFISHTIPNSLYLTALYARNCVYKKLFT